MKFHFEGRLGIEDMSRHIPHRFTVPAGVRTVRTEFHHDPVHPGVGPLPHQLSISIHGPNGARGTRHNNRDQSPIVSESWASPGYTPGPIESGEWLVEIDTARILPPGNVKYTLTVTLSDVAVNSQARPSAAAVAPRGPGWYTGDLHGHSEHSDGHWSVADFIASGRDRGLDFVTLSDHNTVSGIAEAKSLAGDDLLVLGGVELTTFNGHCLALGTDEWVEWRIKDGLTMSAHAARLMQSGMTFVIAHPMSRGHPWCTGCHWAYADVYPGPARLVEIWNSQWPGDKNELGLRLYQAWLSQGFRIMATAGTDIHGPEGANGRVGYNRVYATELTETAILDALRLGHNVLTAGPVLEMSMICGNQTVMVGDMAPEPSGVIDLEWQNAIVNTSLTLYGTDSDRQVRALHDVRVGVNGSHQWAIPAMPECGWIHAIMRDDKGEMLAVTNPIFMPGDWS